MTDNTAKLYNALQSEGYSDLGSYSEFEARLKDENSRKKLHDVMLNDEFEDVGSFEDFNSRLGFGAPAEETAVMQAAIPYVQGSQDPEENYTWGVPAERQQLNPYSDAGSLSGNIDRQFGNYVNNPTNQARGAFQEFKENPSLFRASHHNAAEQGLLPGFAKSLNEKRGSAADGENKITPYDESMARDFAMNTEQGRAALKRFNYFYDTATTQLDKLEELNEKRIREVDEKYKGKRLTQASPFGLHESLTPDGIDHDTETRKLALERDRLTQARNALQAYRDTGERGWLGQFAGEFGRGFVPMIKEIVDFGFGGLGDALSMSAISKKADKSGYESLTDDEKRLLEADALNNAVQGYYQSSRTIPQDVASALEQSAPFMASFGVLGAPARAATRGAVAATKAAFSAAPKFFAKTASGVISTADVLARAASMSLIDPRTYSATIENINGQSGFGINPETNQVVYTGQEGGMSFGQAYDSAMMGSIIEYISEHSGAAFSALGGAVKRAGMRLLNKTVPQLAKRLATSPKYFRRLDDTMRKLGWHGTAEEFFEEQLSLGLNALAGNAEWIDFGDGRQQLVTFLTVASVGLGASVANNTGNRIAKYDVKRNLANAKTEFDKEFSGNEQMTRLVGDILNSDPVKQSVFLNQVESLEDLSPEQKETIFNYVVRSNTYNAMLGGMEGLTERRVDNASRLVDEKTNQYTGTILTGVIGGVEDPVRITSNVVFKEDGSIDKELSDKQLMYVDSEGSNKVTSIDFLEEITENIPAEDAKQTLKDRITGTMEANQANAEVRPYKVGEVVRVAADGNTSIPGEIAGVNEQGGYVLQISTPTGIQQMVVEPRMIINEDNLIGVENGSVVEYRNENGEMLTGEVSDAFNLRPEGLLEIGDEIVPTENVIGLYQPEAQNADNLIANSPENEGSSLAEQNILSEIIAKAPRQSNGEVDYDTLLEQSPEAFAAIYESEEGAEATMVELQSLSDNIGRSIQAAQKKFDNADSINKRKEAKRTVAGLQARKDSIDGIIGRYTQIGETNAPPIEEIPPEDTISPQAQPENQGANVQMTTSPLPNGEVSNAKVTNNNTRIKHHSAKKRITPTERRLSAFEYEALPLRGKILYDIVSGQKFVWGDTVSENGAVISYGLGSSLFGRKSNNNRRGFFNILASSESGGLTPEQYSHALWEQLDQRIDQQEIFNEVLDVLQGVYSNRMTLEELERGYREAVSEEDALNQQIAIEESRVDTNPTEAQKEAGNYQKGHVAIQGLDITIEQPRGSVRSGVDENGHAWETEMQNTYGYIKGTEGRDNDHIDVFLGDNPQSENVFVVDQVNPDTGAFDEHKAMIGFNSIEEAQAAYLSNYEENWGGLGSITASTIGEFKEWAKKEGRRVKPFSEYASVAANDPLNPVGGGSVVGVMNEVPFQSVQESEAINNRFNEELQQQIDGTLPKGHVYRLGNPSAILQSAGIPDLPIEMVAGRLLNKSNQENHPFDLSEAENLPQAVQNPLAVFRSATRLGSNVILTELIQNGKNFVVAIEANRNNGRILVNSIRSMHPRTNSNIINWINEGLMDYADKARMGEWVSDKKKMSRNTFGGTPADAVKRLNSATKIINEFDNPKLQQGNNAFTPISEAEFNALIDKLRQNGLATNIVTDSVEFDRVLKDELQKRMQSLPGDASTMKERQLAMVMRSNPAPNDVNTWIRAIEDILTAEEAFGVTLSEAFGDSMYPDFTADDMRAALDSGEITVYSSYPIETGVFVTPSFMNAEDYAGGEGDKVHSKTVKLTDVAWIDESEGQYTPMRFMKTPTGDVYGFVTPDGVVYIDSRRMNANTPIHEFGHLWNSFIKTNNPELYNRGAELVKESPYWQRMNDNPAYSDLSEDKRVDEALAMAIGDKGDAIVNKRKRKLRDWLNDAWSWIKDALGISEQINIQDMTLEQFADLAVSDLLSGQNIAESENNRNFGNNGSTETNSSGNPEGSSLSDGGTQEAINSVSPVYTGLQELANELRRSASASTSNFERQPIESRITLDFAKEKGLWIDNLYSLGQPLSGGGIENTLALNPQTQELYKSNNLLNSNMLVSTLLEQVQAHNELFPDTRYEVVGFTGIDNGVNSPPHIEVILRQGFIPNTTSATPEDIADYMRSLGFEQVNPTTFTNGIYTVSDLFPRNVLKDSNGNIFVVDNIIRSNTEDATRMQDVSEMETIRQRSITDGSFMTAPNGEPTNLNERQWLQVRTTNFKNWFGDWMNDPENASRVVDSNGEPKVVYHGTTHQFYEFTKDRGNVENHFGIAYYFTDSTTDVENNYLSTGADLTGRITQLAERLESEEDLSEEEARDRAEEELRGSGEIVLDVFLNIKHPIDIRPDGTRFDALEIYDEESGEYLENEESLPMELYNTLNMIQYNFEDADAQSIWNDISEKIGDWDGATAYDVDRALRSSESLIYIQDSDGNLASHEFIRALYEEMGFDGIIMDADLSFGSGREFGQVMEMEEETNHYIVFDSNNIKSATENIGAFSADNADIRFQSVSDIAAFAGESLTESKRKELDKKLSNIAFKLREAYEDSYLAVRRFQDLLKESGMEISEYNDFYMKTTHLPGKNQAEMEQYEEVYHKPLIEALAAIEKEGFTLRDIENYVILKHGPERNETIRNEKLEEFKAKHKGSTPEEIAAFEAELAADFSGMTAVLDEVKMPAGQFVSEFEAKVGKELIDNLWKRVNAATEYSLKRIYEGGFLSKEKYDELKSRWEYYIPLRGHDATTAEDRWDYTPFMGTYHVNPIDKATGRITRADAPFTYIYQSAYSAISASNFNQLKQTFLRLAHKDTTGLLGVNKTWYRIEENRQGDTVYIPQEPEYSPDPKVMQQNIDKFEDRMKELGDKGMAVYDVKKLNIGGLFATPQQAKQHAIPVFRNGVEYQVYVNANPAVSRAVNGLNEARMHSAFVFVGKVSRFMAANFTTRNPTFVATNFTRDFLYASSTLPAKESAEYALKFQLNLLASSDALRRHLWGKGNLTTARGRYLTEFIMNGGKTGFSHIVEIDKVTRRMNQEIKKAKKGDAAKMTYKALNATLDLVASANDFAENLTRFAVYMTSRESGRSVARSVSDAKEVTVNFNRKGSGALGAAEFRSLFLFVNAGIQALANFFKILGGNPGKTSAVIATYCLGGSMIMPTLTYLFGGDDGLEEYMKLSDWERQTNMCFYTGKGFVKIPLPQELRVFHKMGDEIFMAVSGRKPATEAVIGVMSGFADLIPANPAGAIEASWAEALPDAFRPWAQLTANANFTGSPIWDKWADDNMPGYLKVRTNRKGEVYAPEFLVDLLKTLDNSTGGDGVEPGFASLNPDVVNHIFNGYLGGLYTLGTQGINAAYKTFGWSDRGGLKIKETPANRFYVSLDDMQVTSNALNAQYHKIREEVKEDQSKIKRYDKQLDGLDASKLGIIEYGVRHREINEKIKALETDLHFNLSERIEDIKKLESDLKNTDGEEQKRLDQEIALQKAELVGLTKK